jgi:mono/diheme cytochrome c family protein
MKRLVLLIVAVLLIAAAAIMALDLLRDPGADAPTTATPTTPADQAAQIARGAYLARAGNCIACHTARGGPAYAGGRAIATPFGDIYTSNITPDVASGIGAWSASDFWRALHNGKSKDGSFLYPAFPYPDYTKVTRTDADALYAYLRTIAPATRINQEPALRFPFNQRILLAGWRALYFRPGEFRADATQTTEWNRGAYLVQGLGHCSACHTSRNALGGSDRNADLAGGMIPTLNWYAAALTSDTGAALVDWQKDEVVDFLHNGTSRRGAAIGPMAEVISGSLQYLDDADVQAMASYLKALPAHQQTRTADHAAPTAELAATLKQGAALYDKHCAACHQSAGEGSGTAYPPLAGNHTLTAASPVNPIRMVLNGGFAPVTAGNPRPYGMPPFGALLDDTQVAALITYIRASWGNQGEPVSANTVARFRGAPLE